MPKEPIIRDKIAFTKGDILKGADRRKSAAKHYIVFLRVNNEQTFIGAVLTHSDRHSDNIPMGQEHVKILSDQGKQFEFQFEDTYLVKQLFVKPQSWGPFSKIGELTVLGINFVESHTDAMTPLFWDVYLQR